MPTERGEVGSLSSARFLWKKKSTAKKRSSHSLQMVVNPPRTNCADTRRRLYIAAIKIKVKESGFSRWFENNVTKIARP